MTVKLCFKERCIRLSDVHCTIFWEHERRGNITERESKATWKWRSYGSSKCKWHDNARPILVYEPMKAGYGEMQSTLVTVKWQRHESCIMQFVLFFLKNSLCISVVSFWQNKLLRRQLNFWSGSSFGEHGSACALMLVHDSTITTLQFYASTNQSSSSFSPCLSRLMMFCM